MTRYLVLLTVPKSGTNLFRVAIANYIAHLDGDLSRKDYDDMTAMFPNQLHDYVTGTAKPSYSSKLFTDFIYQHGEPTYLQNKETFPGPVVCLVRNPLDYLVSGFHYFYKGRLDARDERQHPFELRDYLPLLASAYSAFRQMDALLLHYEDLFEFPAYTLKRAIEHYGLPVNDELIELAVKHSSRDAARDYEDTKGPMHITKDQVGWLVPGFRFVRDGTIGQWRQYFSREQVEVIRDDMSKLGVPLDNFILTARVNTSDQEANLVAAGLFEGASYARYYDSNIGKMIDERKAAIAELRNVNPAASDRSSHQGAARQFDKLSRIFQDFASREAFTRVVDVGSRDTSYMERLKPLAPGIKEWLEPHSPDGSPGILHCLKYNVPGTLFVSVDGLDLVPPDDIYGFFCLLSAPQIGFLLQSRGLDADTPYAFTMRTSEPGFDHNFLRLARASKLRLREFEVSYDGAKDGVPTHWMSAAT